MRLLFTYRKKVTVYVQKKGKKKKKGKHGRSKMRKPIGHYVLT